MIQFVETQTPDVIPTSQNSEQASTNDDTGENQELLDDLLFPEQNSKDSYDEDPTWTPEEIDRAYERLKEDDSVQTNANPRCVKKSCGIPANSPGFPESLQVFH